MVFVAAAETAAAAHSSGWFCGKVGGFVTAAAAAAVRTDSIIPTNPHLLTCSRILSIRPRCSKQRTLHTEREEKRSSTSSRSRSRRQRTTTAESSFRTCRGRGVVHVLWRTQVRKSRICKQDTHTGGRILCLCVCVSPCGRSRARAAVAGGDATNKLANFGAVNVPHFVPNCAQ